MAQLACDRMYREQIGNNVYTRVMNCFSAHTRVILIFQKLQCLSDTSTLTMICNVMTIHFSCIISPVNCQHFQWQHPMSLSMIPAHPKMGAPEGNLEIVTICKMSQKQTHATFCWLYSPYNCWYMRIASCGVVLYSKNVSCINETVI